MCVSDGYNPSELYGKFPTCVDDVQEEEDEEETLLLVVFADLLVPCRDSLPMIPSITFPSSCQWTPLVVWQAVDPNGYSYLVPCVHLYSFSTILVPYRTRGYSTSSQPNNNATRTMQEQCQAARAELGPARTRLLPTITSHHH